MTSKANALRAQPRLLKLALDHTDDVNEAHLFVHRVMTRAFNGASGAEVMIDPALVTGLGRSSVQTSCRLGAA